MLPILRTPTGQFPRTLLITEVFQNVFFFFLEAVRQIDDIFLREGGGAVYQAQAFFFRLSTWQFEHIGCRYENYTPQFAIYSNHGYVIHGGMLLLSWQFAKLKKNMTMTL